MGDNVSKCGGGKHTSECYISIGECGIGLCFEERPAATHQAQPLPSGYEELGKLPDKETLLNFKRALEAEGSDYRAVLIGQCLFALSKLAEIERERVRFSPRAAGFLREAAGILSDGSHVSLVADLQTLADDLELKP